MEEMGEGERTPAYAIASPAAAAVMVVVVVVVLVVVVVVVAYRQHYKITIGGLVADRLTMDQCRMGPACCLEPPPAI